MITFLQAFGHIVGVEGGLTLDPNDTGNWTGGKQNIGVLKGTKFGISAASYPSEDIKNLTLARAQEIYKRDYWDACQCDKLPSPLNLFVFDAAVNQGVVIAIKLLQKTLGTVQDGVLGRITIAAANRATPDTMAMYMAVRAMRYVGTANFDRFGLGWMKRLVVVAMAAK